MKSKRSKYNQLWLNFAKTSQQWLSSRRRKARLRRLRTICSQLLPRVSELQIQQLHSELSADATWSINYLVCTVGSCLIATFGLISNSTAVIIGAMLVAPLMLPLRGLAFSACKRDFNLFRKALLSIIGATIVSLILSAFIGKIVSLPYIGSEMTARTQPNLIDLGIAIAAGGLSGFAKIRQGISDTLAGTAIAVALMPPLCVVGLSLSAHYYPLATGAFLLYLTNLLGITLACMLIFIISGYTKINHALSFTTLLTLLLIIPLGASFFKLIEQKRIETEIVNKLVNETITIGQNVDNIRVGIIWTKNPPLIYVYLETNKEITPKQVKLVQNYLNGRIKKKFDLVLYVIPVKQISSDDYFITPDTETEIKTKPQTELKLEKGINFSSEMEVETSIESENKSLTDLESLLNQIRQTNPETNLTPLPPQDKKPETSLQSE
jgi:uncharacterized hydrophobic protein (TIGR00271 family)